MKETIRGELVKPRCFVYLRRSQDRDDRQQLSIPKQDQAVKELVKKNDLMPLFLEPEDRSARYTGRPVFDDMIRRIEDGEARYIAVWHTSRLSRNPRDAGMILHLLDTGQLRGIYTPDRVFRNTTDDKTFLSIVLAFDKRENDDLSDKVKGGFDMKRQTGQYPGPAPLGYLNALVGPGQRNLVPDPHKASKIVQLFKMASSGQYTLDDLWRESRDMGLTTKGGRELPKQTLAEMLQRRTYAGYFKYGGDQWYKATYQPLISQELYEKTQLAMGWVKPRRRDRPATTNGRSYTYKGLLVCDNCRFNVTAYTKLKKLRSGDPAEYVFYTCTKKSKTIRCDEHQVSGKQLEDEIRARVSEFNISDDQAAEAYGWLEKFHNEYMLKKNQYRPIWIEDQQKAKRALDILDEKLEQGVISDERYKLRAAQHQEALARTSELLSRSDHDANRRLELAKEVFSTGINIGDVFDEANEDERRRMMRLLGSNWTLGNKKVALSVREPLSALHNSAENNDWRARPDSNRRSPP